MNTYIKLSLIAIMLSIGSQAAIANALQDKIQARKDITAYGNEFKCKDFVLAANKGDLVLIDAFIRAGINPKCPFAASSRKSLASPYRPRGWSNNALTAALDGRHLETAQMLLDYGVPFEQERALWRFELHDGSIIENVELYPRPALIKLLYTHETKKEIRGNERLKALKWAVNHGADVNATEFLGEGNNNKRYIHIISPLTAAMRTRSNEDTGLYNRSLSWVEYLLKHGAKLNPPLAPEVKKAAADYAKMPIRITFIHYPFDLSALFDFTRSLDAVSYRIKLANLLIKHLNAKTDKQAYQKAIKNIKDRWKAIPKPTRDALVKLDKIIQSRI